MIHKIRVRSIQQLKTSLYKSPEAIEMLKHAFQNMHQHVDNDKCYQCNGGHFQHRLWFSRDCEIVKLYHHL